MRPAKDRLRVALLLLVVVAGCDPGGDGLSEWRIESVAPGAAPCPRPEPAAYEPGARVVLAASAEPCDVVAVPVATLRPDPDGVRPDPGSQVVMTRDGRYYSRDARGQQVVEWAADGTFLRAVGRSGEAPGEFAARGAITLFLGADDSLYVLDGAQRWSVFDRDLTFRRVFTGPASGRGTGRVHVTEGHGILTTGSTVGGSSSLPFHLMDLDGRPIRSFGPDGGHTNLLGPTERVSAYVDGTTFWVAPVNGGPSGLVLERWSLDDDLLLTLERRVPWLPVDGYPPVDSPGEPGLPEYDLLHVDPQGLLWIVMAVRDPRWRLVEGDEKEAVQSELYDGRVEVYDPHAGTVLASFRLDGPQESLPPFSRFLPGTGRAYRAVEDSLGLRSIEIFDIRLVAR